MVTGVSNTHAAWIAPTGDDHQAVSRGLRGLCALASRQPEVDDTGSRHAAGPVKVELSLGHSANKLRKSMAGEDGNL